MYPQSYPHDWDALPGDGADVEPVHCSPCGANGLGTIYSVSPMSLAVTVAMISAPRPRAGTRKTSKRVHVDFSRRVARESQGTALLEQELKAQLVAAVLPEMRRRRIHDLSSTAFSQARPRLPYEAKSVEYRRAQTPRPSLQEKIRPRSRLDGASAADRRALALRASGRGESRTPRAPARR